MSDFDYICISNIVIMSQTAFTVRMDADVKKRFDDLCKDVCSKVHFPHFRFEKGTT
jgi:hypothetical protein